MRKAAAQSPSLRPTVLLGPFHLDPCTRLDPTRLDPCTAGSLHSVSQRASAPTRCHASAVERLVRIRPGLGERPSRRSRLGVSARGDAPGEALPTVKSGDRCGVDAVFTAGCFGCRCTVAGPSGPDVQLRSWGEAVPAEASTLLVPDRWGDSCAIWGVSLPAALQSGGTFDMHFR
mmetsp:Transcript_30611/g.76819  ORF Transcript_30611/g.76819 Transcript_30611/m.76819 type:complete len:175 (+) Transcript_30611:165-689(+)